MDQVVDTLRTYDTRWGYNGKRGNANDPSKDVITYHYGPGPDANSTDVYIIDIIGGHCGSTPSPTWIDVTDVTVQSGHDRTLDQPRQILRCVRGAYRCVRCVRCL